MKNTLYKITIAFCILASMNACLDYETQYEGPYEESFSDQSLARVLVYVAGGNVYLANRLAQDSIIIDNSGSVTIASINHEHTKVIFKSPGQNIQIYDIESGNISGEVPNTGLATWYEFHANNETIYFQIGVNLDTYGPEVLPSRPVNLMLVSGLIGGRVTSPVILENGEVVFPIHSASILNTRYLFHIDGNDVISSRVTTGGYEHCRLSADEFALWSGNEFGRLYINRIQELTPISFFNDLLIGAPVSFNSGYTVNDDNQIITPEGQLTNSPGGVISSIDF